MRSLTFGASPAPKPLPLALTMGDPAGVGPELTVRAWRALRAEPAAAFFVIGDPALYGTDAVVIDNPNEARDTFAEGLPVLAECCAAAVELGAAAPLNAPAVLASIDRAVEFVKACSARAVVTNPINKAMLYGAGFRHPGHTEYLRHLAAITDPTVMMLVDGDFRVVPVTLHVSLADAIAGLSPTVISHAIKTTDAFLRKQFGIARPRLAVSGLNPHAGEAGAMGREEIDIIIPTLERLRAEGFIIDGPLPADTMFHARARATYDAALCMTHDQALIPIKTIGFDSGVNTTMGLPFVRTSPDHGTAYGIAGQGVARADSLVAAIQLAASMSA